MKLLLSASIALIVLTVTACSKGVDQKSSISESQSKSIANKSFHGSSSAVKRPHTLVAALKKNHLAPSTTKTIGEAFDSYKYARRIEWKATPPVNDGPSYVDYICWFHVKPVSVLALKEGVKERGLEIKFSILKDGETYIAMARRLDVKSDGKLYATPILPLDIKKIVTSLYENREITF